MSFRPLEFTSPRRSISLERQPMIDVADQRGQIRETAFRHLLSFRFYIRLYPYRVRKSTYATRQSDILHTGMLKGA